MQNNEVLGFATEGDSAALRGLNLHQDSSHFGIMALCGMI